MKKRKDFKRRNVYINILLFILSFFVVIGVSYATVVFAGTGKRVNSVKTGAITMVYTEGTNSVNIGNALPMSDEEGKVLSNDNQVFDFTVSVNITGDFSVNYEVALEKQGTSTLGNQDVKLYLERSNDGKNYSPIMNPTYYVPLDNQTTFGTPAGSMIMDSGLVSSSLVYHYRFRMWVDEKYNDASTSKNFSVKVNVYGSTEKNPSNQ